MRKAQRVLVVTSTFPQHDRDFRGAFIRHHWEAEAAKGQQVRVLAPRSRWVRGPLNSPLDVVRFRYAPRASSTLTGHFGMLENLRESPRRALLVPGFLAALDRAIGREIHRFTPDKVVAHFWIPAGLSVARHCKGRIPYELFGHGTDVDLLVESPGFIRAGARQLLEGAQWLRFPSQQKLERVCERFGWANSHPMRARLRVEMMTHTVTVNPEASAPERGPYLLFLGRLIAQKGVRTLLDALRLVPHAPPLVIAGDGPQRASLERYAQAQGLRVEFVGWVDAEQKSRWLRGASALVAPSTCLGLLGEGAPLVIAEAHAMDCPLIASDAGGIRQLVEELGANATLVAPQDPVELARAIEQHLSARANALIAL